MSNNRCIHCGKEKGEIKTAIYVTTRVPAYHNWPDAPEHAHFLSHAHRHLFHVRVDFLVNHDDRELEFFVMQEKVSTYVRRNWEGGLLKGKSCEMLAKELMFEFPTAIRAEVSEDGENGAYVWR